MKLEIGHGWDDKKKRIVWIVREADDHRTKPSTSTVSLERAILSFLRRMNLEETLRIPEKMMKDLNEQGYH